MFIFFSDDHKDALPLLRRVLQVKEEAFGGRTFWSPEAWRGLPPAAAHPPHPGILQTPLMLHHQIHVITDTAGFMCALESIT